MDDKEAAKLIIKRSKKNPILYSHAEILYVKRIKKLQKFFMLKESKNCKKVND